jgi:hypothetical protein
MLNEQARRSYGSKDRERRKLAKDYKKTSQLNAMKAGESTHPHGNHLHHHMIERSEHISNSRTTEHIVWGPNGTSPCIRCSNRIFILIEKYVVEITLEGLAALQGIPLHFLYHMTYTKHGGPSEHHATFE